MRPLPSRSFIWPVPVAGNMIDFETLGHSGDPTCVLRIKTDELHRWYVHLYFGARTNSGTQRATWTLAGDETRKTNEGLTADYQKTKPAANDGAQKNARNKLSDESAPHLPKRESGLDSGRTTRFIIPALKPCLRLTFYDPFP